MNGIFVLLQIQVIPAAMTAQGALKFGRMLLVVVAFLSAFGWEFLSG